MDVLDAIKTMISESGMSMRKISSELGRAQTYLATTIGKNSDMGASNVARIANYLGWRLVLKKGDVELEISPRDVD